jgi:hypothetical protein
LISNHTELLNICESPKLYISRRSLKHFVERRKSELEFKYTKEIILKRLYFAIEKIEITILEFDSLTQKKDSFIYSKYFDTEYKSFLRVVTEKIYNHEEIKSIHFKKNKKAT